MQTFVILLSRFTLAIINWELVMLRLFVCNVIPEFCINEFPDFGYVSGFRICKPNVVKQNIICRIMFDMQQSYFDYINKLTAGVAAPRVPDFQDLIGAVSMFRASNLSSLGLMNSVLLLDLMPSTAFSSCVTTCSWTKSALPTDPGWRLIVRKLNGPKSIAVLCWRGRVPCVK